MGKNIERVLTAYHEELLSLEPLRERMPPLRQREQALRRELQSIADQKRCSRIPVPSEPPNRSREPDASVNVGEQELPFRVPGVVAPM